MCMKSINTIFIINIKTTHSRKQTTFIRKVKYQIQQIQTSIYILILHINIYKIVIIPIIVHVVFH